MQTSGVVWENFLLSGERISFGIEGLSLQTGLVLFGAFKALSLSVR